MKVVFKKSFLKDLKKLKSRSLQNLVHKCIVQVESAETISKIKNIKKLSGFEFHYRIRVGDYRIGIKQESDVLFFVVLDHRKDIYKNFP